MSKQDSIAIAFNNGWTDRVAHGLLRVEQLYRRPWQNRAAWRLGWELANLLTEAPLRIHRR